VKHPSATLINWTLKVNIENIVTVNSHNTTLSKNCNLRLLLPASLKTVQILNNSNQCTSCSRYFKPYSRRLNSAIIRLGLRAVWFLSMCVDIYGRFFCTHVWLTTTQHALPLLPNHGDIPRRTANRRSRFSQCRIPGRQIIYQRE